VKFAHMPSALYQYHAFDAAGHAVDNLRLDRVWLSAPSRFNDPYDCALTVAMSEVSNEYFRAGISEIITKAAPPFTISDEEIRELTKSRSVVQDLARLMTSKSDKLTSSQAAAFVRALDRAVGHEYRRLEDRLIETMKGGLLVSCFSERRDSIIMWSHYADCHRGFCVEYDFKQRAVNKALVNLLFPVLYTDSLIDATRYLDPAIAADDNNNLYFGILAAISKSPEWAYEKEWRIVVPFGILDREQPLPVSRPRAVYLGARSSRAKRRIIWKACAKRGIDLFLCHLSNHSYAIETVPLTEEDTIRSSKASDGTEAP